MTRPKRSPLATLQDRLAEHQAIQAPLLPTAESAPLRRDMVTFLTFARDTKIVGTPSTGNMPLKTIAALAPLLTEPPVLETSIGDQVYPARSEDQVWPVHFLHILGEVGGLLETGRSRRWKLTREGERFLHAEPAHQLAFTLAVWWHRVNWVVAFPLTGLGEEPPPDFPYVALRYLDSLPIGMDIPFIEYADILMDHTGLIWGSPMGDPGRELRRLAIERMVIDVLVQCGAVQCIHTTAPESGHGKLTSLQLTAPGRALLRAIMLIDGRDFA